MINLKKIKFINYRGYKNIEFDFFDKKWIVFYGPNGIGKSAFLHGISLLSSPWSLETREDTTLFFRRLTFHPDYQPGLEGFDKNKTELYMEAVFSVDRENKKVILQNNWIPEESGVILNELKDIYSIAFNPDADNPMNTQRFQIVVDYAKQFLDFAEDVYGFKGELPENSLVQENKDISFYTDFVITKFNGVKVHYRSFSAGERKIATLISSLFNQVFMNGFYKQSILLIDNVCLHIYFKRHMNMIKNLEKFFPNNQIIATTHSPIIINEMYKKYLYNLEEYIR